MPANLKHQNFIDLMKAAGMLLIIFGHIIGDPSNFYNQLTQPVHTKQIGVAFFVFITGWGLANNTKPPLKSVYNRIFPFYFYGIVFAIFLSILFIFLKGDTNPSNYLPFFFGANVFFDNFPANPTTWYIGTYLHMLLFWYFFIQGKDIGKKHLVLAFIFENIVRCLFMAWGKDFIAYMLLPNWLTVFLLGMYLHKKRQLATTPQVFLLILAWLGVIAVWTYLTKSIGFDGAFPFRNMTSDFSMALPVESLLISATYIVNTLFFFEIARRLPGFSIVSFLARATLITVIVHMPIVFGAHAQFYGLFESEMVARITFIFVLYFGIAVFSELLQRFINIKYLSEKSWLLLNRVFSSFKAT
ncbi:MAG: acyltransferase family protein [Desulfobacterales bacterium]|nr:acyltransferase family protein [Desulfobacterales bacterium]